MANILQQQRTVVPPSQQEIDVDTLIKDSDCYRCIPTGMQNEVIIYLLNQILGTNLTPQQLMDESKCYKCIPAGMQMEVQIYLLCQIVASLE